MRGWISNNTHAVVKSIVLDNDKRDDVMFCRPLLANICSCCGPQQYGSDITCCYPMNRRRHVRFQKLGVLPGHSMLIQVKPSCMKPGAHFCPKDPLVDDRHPKHQERASIPSLMSPVISYVIL